MLPNVLVHGLRLLLLVSWDVHEVGAAGDEVTIAFGPALGGLAAGKAGAGATSLG